MSRIVSTGPLAEKSRSKRGLRVVVKVEGDLCYTDEMDMATNQASEFIQHLRRAMLLRDGAALSDKHLLEDFINSRDEVAMAVLVRRHGPMVWSVCRRLLSHHDAEDAFQATFLVLVRKGASIASRDLLANWLYGVAHQTALKARATAAKRKGRERQLRQMPEPAATEQDLWRDLGPLLDQELSLLPDKYRAVIVLCDLEGMTRKEAARQLGVPEGTVASRMATARAMLAKRLTRHGLAVSGGTLAAVLSRDVASARVPTSVVPSTIQSASRFAARQLASADIPSADAIALAEGVLKSMLQKKLKTASVTLFLIAVLGSGAVGLTRQTKAVARAETTGQAPVKQAGSPQKAEPEAADRRAAVKREKQRLQGLWEDCEKEGDTYLFEGNTLAYHSKRENATYKWSYRIDLPRTSPPSIDIFSHIDTGPGGTGRGVYELDGDDLTIVYAEPRGARAMKFERGGGNTLLVLKRVGRTTPSGTPEAKEAGQAGAKDTPLVVHAVLERVDARQAVITAEAVSGNSARAVLRLLSFVVSDGNPSRDNVAHEIDRALRIVTDHHPKLVDLPVRSDAKIVRGKQTLTLKDLRPGGVLALQLAADRSTGLVVVGIRVLDDHADKKP